MSEGFVRGDVRVPVYRLRSFDDGVLWSPRVLGATGGRARKSCLKCFDDGHGDFETCCRAVSMLCELWSGESSDWFGRAVVAVMEICCSLTPREGLVAALRVAYNVGCLDGSIDGPNLIAWCAVCCVKGGKAYDCCAALDDFGARSLIVAVFWSFCRLNISCYNDKQLQDLLLGGC